MIAELISMAIARKPNSKPKSPMDEAAADAFIAGAAKPKAEPIATEADEAGQGAEPPKAPVMLRFDRALLAKVEAAAKRRGIGRSQWVQVAASLCPAAGEGWDGLGQGAEPRKSPVMLRFDRALLAKVDAAAKRRGISRSAWIQFTVSRALDAGEG